jgi:hypothetical protein
MSDIWMKKMLVVVAGLLTLAVPMFGHHGTNISYDSSKPLVLKAVMTDFRYANPHPQLFFDVTDETGKVTKWAAEVAPTPFTLQQNGWSKARATEALKPGTRVTVTVGPARAGTPVGLLMKVVNEQGEQLLTGRDD